MATLTLEQILNVPPVSLAFFQDLGKRRDESDSLTERARSTEPQSDEASLPACPLYFLDVSRTDLVGLPEVADMQNPLLEPDIFQGETGDG